ncbi:hypothetical protein B0J13DRAFT_559442 [Dactylonectria estremocensis]|uniref:Secreted protein n=1 Tax=Dactylonectria estremocensis TaxID=1079267 RepID=A0A9P9J047_9HYPO|nr:hypothetical protein B0J13DRAFT_559442 [Dactylonectria estremocensis]
MRGCCLVWLAALRRLHCSSSWPRTWLTRPPSRGANADPHGAEIRHVVRSLATGRAVTSETHMQKQMDANGERDCPLQYGVRSKKNQTTATMYITHLHDVGGDLLRKRSSRENWPMASCT